MRKNQLHSVSYLKDRRKELRKNPTPAEAALWELLRIKKLKNKKFRRQHSIGNYIVDFYCASAKLIIELDGIIHNYNRQQDMERDETLKSYGYKVIRFKNEMIFEEPDTVLTEIEKLL